MDSLAAVLPGYRDDLLHVEIGIRTLAIERVGDIRAAQMTRGTIVLTVDRHGLYPHITGGTRYANSDFATVGDQQSADRSPGGGEVATESRSI